MRTQRLFAVLFAVMLCGSALFFNQAEAVRPLQVLQLRRERPAGDDYLTLYPAVYDKARTAVVSWLGRLPAGPSPRGPGH